MASVTSLGLHQPTALPYLIQEHLLPTDPRRDAYTWQNVSFKEDDVSGDDELLTTKTSVVWSRGGVVRKCFRFEVEEEPVTQAILTTFPATRNQPHSTSKKDETSTKIGANEQLGQAIDYTTTRDQAHRQSKAIVVFLKTQAHVYFLSGTSHVIHLPFEVEYASAAPNGLILQRKLQTDRDALASLKLPRVPPNSFISSQPQPWSAKSSQQSTFSVASLGSPKQLPLPTTALLGDLWPAPVSKNDSNWPRLFSLTDPLAEMGLLVMASKPNVNRRTSLKASTMDSAEEIIYVTKRNEFAAIEGVLQDPLILAVTLNRETNMYTIWKMAYIDQEDSLREKAVATSGTLSRRRSSFAPGTATGAATPISGQYTLRESLGGGGNKSRREENIAEDKLDLATTLDPDFESNTVPRRKSRRVSSMLARADLSASHERVAFSELASQQHTTSRRGESFVGHRRRNSLGLHSSINSHAHVPESQLGNSINSFLEAPVDDLLEELRAGGDFEGFNTMGLDDVEFDGLKKEVILSKIESIPVEHSNVRFSSQHKPAQAQYRTFALAAPLCAAEDLQRHQIVICILDVDDKKLLVLTLNARSHSKADGQGFHNRKAKRSSPPKEIVVVTASDLRRATGVLDACKLTDGGISRILLLTETANGVGELTLQAPWSRLVKVALPPKLTISNIGTLSHDATPQKKREGGFKRVLSNGPRALRSLRNSLASGIFDLVDDEEQLHRVRIRMEPQTPIVLKIVEICRFALPGSKGGEDILIGWWSVRQWLGDAPGNESDLEWTAIVVLLFSMVLGMQKSRTPSLPDRTRKSRSFLRSSSGAQSDVESWQTMLDQNTAPGSSRPLWTLNDGWAWLVDQEEIKLNPGPSRNDPITILSKTREVRDGAKSLRSHIKLAREYLASSTGEAALGSSGYLPTAVSKNFESRQKAIVDIMIALHLFREEQKIDITLVDSLNAGTPTLTPVMAQICKWLGWSKWTEIYEVEDAAIDGPDYESAKILDSKEPLDPPSIYEWIASCIIARKSIPSLADEDISPNRWGLSIFGQYWSSLTPRTASFARFFATIRQNSTPAEIVEALYNSGITRHVLDTLPEAILVPLREAIVDCQAHPPVHWGKDLLNLVDREDVNMFLLSDQQRKVAHAPLLTPTHESNSDIRSICATIAEPESVGSFDGSAEVDRQAITRLVFKDDRRFNEAAKILNTSKPTIARCEAEPEWSDSDLLEAQKEHVQMLAIRTLAIPIGRGLLYYSARIPLLTEKFPIGGFNLHCIMKPTNNTVAVDKNAFTEEKVCWAFFHAGVAAGLSISRAAKGIDTSWIQYNRPQELSNRHAGFLLALGLNGHLKSVAKWVAFKYLTPKHTMTSIGLLLGLAASYLGTMDSLITRLLSVHVTRMLPSGAAELNLSPLTQTTGIVGIGLLYCNTQHRRMSEIMLSEIEHTDPEMDDEPLRNEGYRLAAGFALGLINLGKGSDLKGLHDLRVTERLLSLAVETKKVNLVHVLDKATAAAAVAIALIFMKSENRALARKIDVPDSILQYDYVRPDIFLLRTLAKNLIMWSEIEASVDWIASSLPKVYHDRSSLINVDHLSTEDLPFYDIITGLCFSIALRHAGSGSIHVRDLLLHYLDQMMRICNLPSLTYDQKLTRSTTRNCQDLLALSVSTVMAGTGDLAVFRRLRALHGRDDGETPYGSHIAAHTAVGALFLGGGTYTFGTSNLAIAALIVAFYPIFPTSILDNKSHLQAFRHFWVLATEPRCIIARDIDTYRPVSIPLSITLRNGGQSYGHAPCLLPELQQVASVSTSTREYWNVVLDFEKNPKHLEAFKSSQTIFVRRRPAYDASTALFHATLQALDDTAGTSRQPLEWLFELPVFKMLTTAEKALVLPPDNIGSSIVQSSNEGTLVDTRLVLEKASLMSGKKDRLQGLKLLFEWAEKMQDEGREMQWIRREVLERLKAQVWMMAMRNA